MIRCQTVNNLSNLLALQPCGTKGRASVKCLGLRRTSTRELSSGPTSSSNNPTGGLARRASVKLSPAQTASVAGNVMHNGKTAYALKIQSKRELLDQRQASSAVRERGVMVKLDHPFVCKLVARLVP